MRKLLLIGLLALPGFAADLTKLKVVVTNMSGKPVDRADVVVKFVEGRSVVKFGRKIRTQLGDAHVAGWHGRSARGFPKARS